MLFLYSYSRQGWHVLHKAGIIQLDRYLSRSVLKKGDEA